MKRIIALISIILSTLALDQISKAIVVNTMTYGEIGTIPIIPNFLHLTYIHNDGMAFGLADNTVGRVIFMAVSTVAIIGIGIYLFRFCKEGMLLQTGLALIVSGGIGNMIDRIFRYNVIDMIDFRGIWHYIFNVADAFVCIGAFIVALALILSILKEKKNPKEDKNGNK